VDKVKPPFSGLYETW